MMGQGVISQGAELKVFSTNSPNEVLQELVPQFEHSSGHKVNIVYDTPTLILHRIKQGETADLIFINPDTIDDLAKLGKVVAATKKILASISMGVAVRRGLPKPDISSVEAFKNTLLAAESIAHGNRRERQAFRQAQRTARHRAANQGQVQSTSHGAPRRSSCRRRSRYGSAADPRTPRGFWHRLRRPAAQGPATHHRHRYGNVRWLKTARSGANVA